MKNSVFTKGIKIESNTYYRADALQYDYYLNDSTRSYNSEYRSHTTNAGEYLDIALLLCNLENVVLDFCGATLIFHGRIQPFMLDNCKNVTIKNVKLDYDRPFYTQATVLECNEDIMRVKFDEGFNYRVDPSRRGLVVFGDTWEYSMNRNDCLLWMYDPADKQFHSIILALFGEEIYPKENAPMPIGKILVEEDGDAVLFRGNFPKDWIGRTDRKLVITHEPRDKSLIQTVGGEDISLDCVQVLHGSAMALTGMHTKNITVNHFDFIGNYNGNGRIVTNNADGIHLFNCYGKIEIKNCIMEGLLDDTVNIHGNFLPIMEVLKDGFLSDSRIIYGISGALKLFLAGDRIAVCRGRTREKIAEFTLSEAETDMEHGIRVLRVNETELLSDICMGDVIENLSANPEILIENCTFKRFRGTMRLQSGGKTVIRNCRFENRSTSFMMTGDTAYWYESGPVTDLTVENCYFAHAQNWRIVNSTQVEYTDKAPYYHSGITVKNCFFDGKYSCRFDHVDNITFVDNKASEDELLISLRECGTTDTANVKEI